MPTISLKAAKLTSCDGNVTLQLAPARQGTIRLQGMGGKFLCESCHANMTEDGRLVGGGSEDLLAECRGCGHTHHVTARDANGEQV
jgi:RNase P subunit RPR2